MQTLRTKTAQSSTLKNLSVMQMLEITVRWSYTPPCGIYQNLIKEIRQNVSALPSQVWMKRPRIRSLFVINHFDLRKLTKTLPRNLLRIVTTENGI